MAEGRKCLFLSFSLLLMMFFCGRTEAASHVESVRAEVTAERALPVLARGRMEQSVEAIAGQLLTGCSLEELRLEKSRDEALIMEIFDKVLIGYTVTGVSIEPGENVLVKVRLVPWDATIEQVKPIIAVEGMPSQVETLVRQDAAGLEEIFSEALLGLPVAAGDWTAGVIRQEVKSYLACHLPEFRADFELKPGRKTQVEVVLYPRLPVVRTADLSMRSDTIPNVTLLAKRKVMQEKCDELIGVPVGFLERHRETFEKALAEELDKRAGLSRWKISTQVEIQAGERTKVMSRSDTDRYRLRLEGWLDVGHRGKSYRKGDRDITMRLHAGAMLSKRDEVFALLDIYPEKPDWGWQAGYGRSLSSKGRTEVRYDLRERHWILAASQQLARHWLLRYEYRWGEKMWEGALRYQPHDFMAFEYVIDKDDSWMRVIGYF